MNRPYFLQYDIPTIRGTAVMANPSDALWNALCVRITKSCWLAMERNLHRVYPICDVMTRARVVWYLVPFDISATDTLRKMALENIRREIQEKVAEAEETRRQAEIKLDDETEGDFRKRRRAFMSSASAIDRRVREMLYRVELAASEFGITAHELMTADAVGSVNLISANMRDRARTFAAAHGIAVRTGLTAEAAAMRQGRMHPSILADLLDDTAEDDEQRETARDLRHSFLNDWE